MCDEAWVYVYDTENRRKSSKIKSAIISTEESETTQEKDQVHIDFFHNKGIVHNECVPPDQTVNSAFYVEVLRECEKKATKQTAWQDMASPFRHCSSSCCSLEWMLFPVSKKRKWRSENFRPVSTNMVLKDRGNGHHQIWSVKWTVTKEEVAGRGRRKK